MFNFIKALLLWGMLLVVSSLAGQDQKNVREIFIPIDSTYTQGDSIFTYISAGKDLGLEKGFLVRVYSKWRPANSSFGQTDFAQAGFGWIRQTGDDNSVAVIELFNSNGRILKGDVLAVNIEVPALAYRSIFSELAFLNIELQDIERNPLFTLRDILWTDSKQVEDSIVNVMINDIKATYEMVKDMDGFDELKKPLVGSRFKGKSVFDVMREVDAKAVHGFLVFVKYYPGKYIAGNFKGNETFATWVLNNAPYTKIDIYNALYPVFRNPVQFKKLFEEYRGDITGSDIVESLSEQAVNLSNERKMDEAVDMIAFAKTIADALNEKQRMAAFHYHHAQILQDQQKYAEAIEACDLSIKAAIEFGKKGTELDALMKKAFCFYKISEYQKAREALALAEQKSESYRSEIAESVYQTILKKRYEYEGWIYADEGNFDQAIDYYTKAIAINEKINTYESKLKNAEYLSYMGGVLNSQGKQEKALEVYQKAARVYFGIRDEYNYARMLNNIGYTQYMSSQYRTSMATLEDAYQRMLALNSYNEAGYAKTVTGSAYWELGKFDSAVSAHKTAIALREKSNNKSGQAYSWKQIGELYLLSGLKNQALNAFETSAALYDSVKNLAGVAETYIKAGEVHHNDENYYKAAQFYEKAKGVTTKTTVEALYKLGNAWSRIDREKAIGYFEECKHTSNATGNTTYKFYATKSLASLSYAEAAFDKGDKYYYECLQLATELNTPEVYAYCHSLRGDRFVKLSQMDSALRYYQAALEIFDTVSFEDMIWQKASIANAVYISTGEFDKAEQLLLEAATKADETNKNIAQGNALQSLYFLYALMGEVPKALEANDSAMNIFKRSGNILRMADAYASRGTVYKVIGEYSQSIEALNYADSVYAAERIDYYRQTTLNNIGVTYYNQGDYAKALEYLDRSAKYLPENLINEEYLLYRGNAAECHFHLKNEAEAKRMSLKDYPEAEKRNLNRIASGMALILGNIYLKENDLDNAEVYFESSRKYAGLSKERSKMVESLTQLGRIDVKRDQTDKALEKFRSAIAIAKQYSIPGGWESYYEMGLAFYNQMKFDSCISYFRTAVDLLNKYTANVYGGEKAKKLFNNDPKKADLYFKLSFAYSKAGKPEEAFAFANLSGLAGLRELSGGGGKIEGYEKEMEELEKKKQKADALRESANRQTGQSQIEIRKQLEIAEEDYTNYLQGLVQKDKSFSEYFPQLANPGSFLQYKGDLPDDVAIVLYLLNGNNLMTFSLTNEELSIQVDSLSKDITGVINAFRSLTRRPGKSTGTESLHLRAEARDEDEEEINMSFVDASDQLYKVLIGSVYDKIKAKKRICIIPSGTLSNLPFQCLGEKKENGKFNFLIEDFSLFYTNNINIFSKGKDFIPVKADLKSFAAFGVPDATLKFNTKEVEEIGKLIGVSQTIYADARATEGLAKSSLTEKKFLHFATHGVLNYSSDFTSSYLKFLPDSDSSKGNDGKLTITEIQRMMLRNVDMVTLSACETAVNKQLTEGWNISPANAFLSQNVKSVVASLWKVDDEATSILMNEYYSNLDKKMDKVDALRLAQVKLSSHPKYSHPFFWGAFVLYGEWR